MTQTTNAQTACDVTIKLESSSSAFVDISGSSNQVTWALTSETTTYRNAGTDEYPKRLVIGKDATMTLVIVYTSSASEAMGVLRDWQTESIAADNSRAVELYIPSETPAAGRDSVKWSFDAVLNDLDIPMKAMEGGPIMVTANIAITGELSDTILTT